MCTDSWAVYQGLPLWLPTWYRANWLFGHRSLWGQELWQDLWACGLTKIITVYHVTGHLPLASPGNDEADKLAQIRWLEGKPASDVAQWLHQCLLHAGQKTMSAVARQWGLPLTFKEVSRAQQECVVCYKRDSHQVPQQHGTIARGPIPLIRWQIDYIGPLPVSEGYQYAMTSVDDQKRPGASSFCCLWLTTGN